MQKWMSALILGSASMSGHTLVGYLLHSRSSGCDFSTSCTRKCRSRIVEAQGWGCKCKIFAGFSNLVEGHYIVKCWKFVFTKIHVFLRVRPPRERQHHDFIMKSLESRVK
jgi:hypothetical protein